jgi:DNA-directed RNA polymerase specialized sigma24 family protein
VKGWILTEDAFTRLLKQLDPNRERAAEKYEEIRRKLMKFFKWRGCLQFEEYTDRTIDLVARKIAAGEELQAATLSALFYGVASNLLKEYWRKSPGQPSPLEERVGLEYPRGDPETIRQQEEALRERESRLACLRRCLGRLPSESLHLIKQYYSEGEVLDKERRKQIAERLNLSATALRSRAFRIRGELEQCVNGCLRAGEPGRNSS